MNTDQSDSIEVYAPIDGAVEGILGFGLLYLLVDRLTPTILDTLARPLPQMVPEPVTTGLAGLLWLGLATTVFGVVRTFLDENPREFRSEDALRAWLDAVRPTPIAYLRWAILFVSGSIVAAATWVTAFEVLDGLLGVLTDFTGQVPAEITILDTVLLVVFFVGFGFAARAIDSLIIGALRELQYRLHEE